MAVAAVWEREDVLGGTPVGRPFAHLVGAVPDGRRSFAAPASAHASFCPLRFDAQQHGRVTYAEVDARLPRLLAQDLRFELVLEARVWQRVGRGWQRAECIPEPVQRGVDLRAHPE